MISTHLRSKLGSFAGLCGVVFAALFVTPAQATTSTGFVTLTSIKGTTGSSGQLFFGTSAAWPSGEGCTSTAYILIQVSSQDYSLDETILYDAYVNGDQVSFTLSGCSTIGSQSYAIISNFIVQKS